MFVAAAAGASSLFNPPARHGDDEAAAKEAAPPVLRGKSCGSGEPLPHPEAGVATSDGRVAAGGPSGSLKALFIGRGTGILRADRLNFPSRTHSLAFTYPTLTFTYFHSYITPIFTAEVASQ